MTMELKEVSSDKIWTVRYTNTQIQIQKFKCKYTNTQINGQHDDYRCERSRS